MGPKIIKKKMSETMECFYTFDGVPTLIGWLKLPHPMRMKDALSLIVREKVPEFWKNFEPDMTHRYFKTYTVYIQWLRVTPRKDCLSGIVELYSVDIPGINMDHIPFEDIPNLSGFIANPFLLDYLKDQE